MDPRRLPHGLARRLYAPRVGGDVLFAIARRPERDGSGRALLGRMPPWIEDRTCRHPALSLDSSVGLRHEVESTSCHLALVVAGMEDPVAKAGFIAETGGRQDRRDRELRLDQALALKREPHRLVAEPARIA